MLTNLRAGIGVHRNPYMHALFVLLCGICVLALVLTIICDPGTIVTPTSDELKPVGFTTNSRKVHASEQVPVDYRRPHSTQTINDSSILRSMSGGSRLKYVDF